MKRLGCHLQSSDQRKTPNDNHLGEKEGGLSIRPAGSLVVK